MEIKFNVKRKYVVNGKEYGSIEEMPAAIREAYEKAVSGKGGIHHENTSSISAGKIVFNGQEYDSVDSMPSDIRQLYETVMKTVNEGKISLSGNVDFKFGRKTPELGQGSTVDSYNMSQPIAPKSFFSPRSFVVGAAIIILLVGIYFLFIMGSH